MKNKGTSTIQALNHNDKDHSINEVLYVTVKKGKDFEQEFGLYTRIYWSNMAVMLVLAMLLNIIRWGLITISTGVWHFLITLFKT
jgi:hypothetical protein